MGRSISASLIAGHLKEIPVILVCIISKQSVSINIALAMTLSPFLIQGVTESTASHINYFIKVVSRCVKMCNINICLLEPGLGEYFYHFCIKLRFRLMMN